MFKRKELRYTNLSKEIKDHLKFRNSVWISDKGKETKIMDMDKNYLLNVIKKHKRNGYGDQVDLRLIDILKMELIYRQLNNNKKTN